MVTSRRSLSGIHSTADQVIAIHQVAPLKRPLNCWLLVFRV